MDFAEERTHEYVSSFDSLDLMKRTPRRSIRNQFQTHSHRIDGPERNVKENMRMTKKIAGNPDTHLIDLPREYKGLADDIVWRII